MKLCAIRIRGQLAHWRKPFTTTSALTYTFPPRTAVIGLLGAILGVKREELPKSFGMSQTKIAICPMRRIIKDRISQIWRQGPTMIKGKKLIPNKMDEVFQETLEVIRYPDYMILFWHEEDKLIAELVERLKNRRWHYPPYLGILGFFANVTLEDEELEVHRKSERKVTLHSVLPMTDHEAKEIKPTIHGIYSVEKNVPVDVQSDRIFRYVDSVYVEVDGQPFLLETKKSLEFFKVREKNLNVSFFEKSER